MMAAWLAAVLAETLPAAAEARVKVRTDPDRVKAPLVVDLPRIGTLAPRTASEVGDSMWTIGCECLDRDFASFEEYRDFLPALGIRKIRLQAGWAKCERERGKYDFRWLDDIVDWAIAHGLDPMLETCYGNPLYANGGSAELMGSTFPSGEALEAWDRWVEALVVHFRDRVLDYEMWNESNNVPANTPKLIAEHNVHTAKVIRRVCPDARIAGLVLGGDWARDIGLCLAEMGDDAKLFKWFMFHRYACSPESEIDVLLDRKALVRKYNPDGVLRQGESGATSEMVDWFSFGGVPFTEITQAKTNLRRMLTDFACGIPTSVFTICDLHYRNGGKVSYNPKGLLRADDANRVIGVKRAYYAVQNCVSVFDSAVRLVAAPKFENRDSTIFWREYERDGAPLIAFWQYAEVQGDFRKTKEAPGINIADGRTRYPRASDRCDTFPTVFRTKSPPMKEPVWADLLTGRVYAIPPENVLSSESGTVYIDVPCYDSPALLAERRALGAIQDADDALGRLRLGMAGYTFKAVRDVDAMLGRMLELGVRYLCVKDFHLPFSATDEEIGAFLAKCRAHDVVPYAIGPVYMKDRETAVAAFEFARRIGVGLVVGVPYKVAPGKEDGWGPDRLESRELCEFISDLCRKYDMRFAIHNHGPALENLFPTAESVWKRICDLDPRMGICLDLAHEYRSFREPADSVRRYGSRIFDVHLDNVESNADPAQYLATTLPRGALDIGRICRALAEKGYDGVLAIEYAKNFEDNMADLKESVRHFNMVTHQSRGGR